MIEVIFYKDGQYLKGFSFEGHADVGEYGCDLVCNAVSVLVINTVNSLEAFTDAPFSEDSDNDGGYLRCILEADPSGSDVQLLMKALELGILQLADSYPDSVRVVYSDIE